MKLKCAMCGGPNVLGATQALERGGNNPVSIRLEFIDASSGDIEGFTGVRRGSVCLDCGHVALFVSESVRKKLREKAAAFQPVPDDSDR